MVSISKTFKHRSASNKKLGLTLRAVVPFGQPQHLPVLVLPGLSEPPLDFLVTQLCLLTKLLTGYSVGVGIIYVLQKPGLQHSLSLLLLLFFLVNGLVWVDAGYSFVLIYGVAGAGRIDKWWVSSCPLIYLPMTVYLVVSEYLVE